MQSNKVVGLGYEKINPMDTDLGGIILPLGM
jgi:hypothetical protein